MTKAYDRRVHATCERPVEFSRDDVLACIPEGGRYRLVTKPDANPLPGETFISWNEAARHGFKLH